MNSVSYNAMHLLYRNYCEAPLSLCVIKYNHLFSIGIECILPENIVLDKVCDPGEYLDLEGDHDCHKCPKGTYSQGSGAKINHWPENDTEIYLPLGFALDRTYISYSNNECSGLVLDIHLTII